MPLEPGRDLAHYRLLEPLGEGGMGVVWKAVDAVLDREVAIKVLPEAFRTDLERHSRFRREAKLLASLNHPNVAAIYGLHESEGIDFLCMELVPGEDLAQRLHSGPLTLVEVLDIAGQIAEALEATHAEGVIHRDLKPANVAITPSGRVKILDFGLAKALVAPFADDDASSAPTISSAPTREGMVMGTVAYMSPEQARGQAVDERTDIWAFGCVLFEAISGKPAFGGATAPDRLAAVLKSDPDWHHLPDSTPSWVIELVERCLRKDPEERIRSMSEIREVLSAPRSDKEPTGRPAAEARAKSIAVLPFVNMSSDPEQDYFCEGIAEELINGLGRIEELHVAARTSAFQFKGSGFDIREVGERLNVETILEGSVRKAGNRLRITTQLVNVGDGYRLWSEKYDRTLDDIFAIQDEIAENIVQRLEVTLRPAERRALHNPAAQNIEAYDCYLRGRKFFHRWERTSWELAIEMYERAIERDPEYARAYSGIAECSVSLFVYGGADEAMSRRADEASLRALELAPDLAEAHAARGLVVSWLHGKQKDAEAHFERAIELNPKLYENYYFYARSSAGQGEYERAVRLYEKAMELRPDDYQVPLLMPQVYRSLGRDADAEAVKQRGIELAERAIELNPGDLRALVLGASILIEMGRETQGLEWVQRAVKLAPRETMVLYNAACAYAVASQPDKALDALESAIEEGYRQRSWIETDSELESLRDHPRYDEILARIDTPS